MPSSQPRIFISYSWAFEPKDWVINLAHDLASKGVEVILDKWSLREGEDAYFFMEKMVTDGAITKVIIVSDKTYAEKADGRSGGVGTETQIISREIYEKTDQRKFVVAVVERDENNKQYLPTFAKSRVFIDFSESEYYDKSLEQLLRWIYDKPLHEKPPIGPPPTFLTDNTPSTGTSTLARSVVDGLRHGKASTTGLITEYLEKFSDSLENFRINQSKILNDELVTASIESFLPARNELLSTTRAIIQYEHERTYTLLFHKFFERLLRYYNNPKEFRQFDERNNDNFKFIVHEIFLYFLGTLVHREKLETAHELLSAGYYTQQKELQSYQVFREHLETLDGRATKINADRAVVRPLLLKDRNSTSGLDFSLVMQADFVCYVRSLVFDDGQYGWWPETLAFINWQSPPFEIFVRSTSQLYLAKVIKLFGVNDLATLKISIDNADRRDFPRWGGRSLPVASLMALDKLGTQP